MPEAWAECQNLEDNVLDAHVIEFNTTPHNPHIHIHAQNLMHMPMPAL